MGKTVPKTCPKAQENWKSKGSSWRTEGWHSKARDCFSDEKLSTIGGTVNNTSDTFYTKYSAGIYDYQRTVFLKQKPFFPHGVGCSLQILEIASDLRWAGC